MAAPAEELTSEIENGGDCDGREHDNQEMFSDAPEHLGPSEIEEEPHEAMPEAHQTHRDYGHDMYGNQPDAAIYDRDPGQTQDQPQYDDRRYDMQEQYSNDPMLLDQEPRGRHQPAQYYEEQYEEAQMHPEMTQKFVANPSDRARVVADFQRVAAEDDGSYNEQARYFPGRSYRPNDHTGSKSVPRVPGQPKPVKRSSRKKKKPPASLVRAAELRNAKSAQGESGYPTPANDRQAGRNVHFPSDQHQKGIYDQQQHNVQALNTQIVDQEVRDGTPELQLQREMQTATVPNGRRPLSAGLLDRPARHDEKTPPTPPPTRSALSYSASRQNGLNPALGQLTASNSTNRQRFDSRNALNRQSLLRTAPRANAPATYAGTTPSSDPIDHTQVLSQLGSKMTRDQNKREARDRAEREMMQRQLEQTSRDKQAVEIQCHALQQEKQNLEAEITKCKGSLAGFRNTRTYVDTFGNDLAFLQRDSSARQLRSDQLISEGRQRQDQQDSLLQQLRDDVERTVQLRNEALKACREAKSELSSAALQHSQLQQDVNLKNKLLVEEKTLRLQLQGQLSAAGHDKEAILRQLKSNNDTVLDKFFEIHGTLEESNNKQEANEALEKIATAVQSLGSRSTASVEDVVAVKALVESLAENIANTPDVDAETIDQTPALKTCIEESLNGLKAELINQEKLATEASACRETIAGLNEKLKLSDERALEYKTEIAEAHAKETEANELNATLKVKIAELEHTQTNNAASSTNVQGIEADLRAKSSALDAMRTELDAKKEELSTLQATNASLTDEIQTLKRQLEELSAASTAFEAERAEWDKKLADAVQQTRKDLIKHVANVQEGQRSDSMNKEKQQSKNDEKLKKKENELRETKSELEKVQTEFSEQEHKLQEQLTAAEKLARSHAKKAENLQAVVDGLQESTSSHADVAKKNQELQIQLQSEKSEVERLDGIIKALKKQIEAEKANRSNADSATESAQGELEISRAELEGAKKQLAEALQKVAEHEEGMERLKASSDEVLKKEKETAQSQQAALQDELEGLEKDLKEQQQKQEAFHKQVEDSWTKERARQEATLTSANEKVQHAEAQRNEAQIAVSELQTRLEEVLRTRSELPAAQSQTYMKGSADRTETANNAQPARPDATISHGLKASKGITPTATSDFTQPTRPRKVVNRDHQSVKEVSAIPAPELLRPSSARPATGESESISRGPVVEESQQGLMAQSEMPLSSPQAESFNPFEVNRSAPAPKPAVLSQSRDQEVVPETQFDDSVPSFAAFHANRASMQHKVPVKNSYASSHHQTAPEFQIYEDANDPVYASTQDAPQYLQHSLPPAKDPYTYEKPMPPPNSSSKRVRNHSDGSHHSRGSRGQDSSQKKVERRKSSQLKTPEPTRVPGGAGIPNLSSSPGFMTTSKPARTKNTYNGESGKKRRTSRRQSDIAKEAASQMPAPPKRKSESAIVAGYEEERRKRVKPSNAAPTPRRDGLRSLTQPSGTQSSYASLMSDLSLPPGPSRGGSQTSRMQTLAGQPARPARGGQKQSRHDQMSARFQQELNMGRR